MPITFNAVNEEFATSTGSNVNSGSGTSTFDYPPSSSFDLVISANPDDLTPYTFEVGDTYDISWNGPGGGGTIEDAVILRSDPVTAGGDSGHVVVFEGLDENGNVAQIVWSPDFDLDSWYDNVAAQGHTPSFYTGDTDASASYTAMCFVAGTRIKVPGGMVSVETLRAGDLVLTQDHGAQKLLWIGDREVPGHNSRAPIEFAPGTIGNDAPLRLSPQHRVLYPGWMAEMMFGTAEVLVPAKAFLAQHGVRQVPVPKVRYVHLLFERHEIVEAEGAPCESLFMGDVALKALQQPDDPGLWETGALFPEILQRPEIGAMRAARRLLKLREAASLLGPVPGQVIRATKQPMML